jgi:hypothetical protein
MELYSFQVQRALADALLISPRREQKRSCRRNEITIFHDSTSMHIYRFRRIDDPSRILSAGYNRSVCGEQAGNAVFSR